MFVRYSVLGLLLCSWQGFDLLILYSFALQLCCGRLYFLQEDGMEGAMVAAMTTMPRIFALVVEKSMVSMLRQEHEFGDGDEEVNCHAVEESHFFGDTGFLAR